MGTKKNSILVTSNETRRKLLRNIAITLGGLMTASIVHGQTQPAMTEAQSSGTEGLLTYLHQEIDIKASPQRIYDALLDSKQFTSMTGMAAEISRDAGGPISIFGGMVLGRNIELVPNQRIVQAWRPGNWAPGVYSIVKFEIKSHDSQSIIVLDHTGFPESNFRHLNSGWYERYWEPLKKYLS